MYQNFKVLLFCLLLALPNLTNGQGTGNSPYSQYGVGDLTSQIGSIRNIGMGNAGVSNRHHFFINYLNPALLPNLRNSKKLRKNHKYLSYDHFLNLKIDSTVKIDFGLTYQMRALQNASGVENTNGLNMAYLAFSLPISKTWATSIGIRPFSTVNYNLNYSAPVEGDPSQVATKENIGTGGIYKIFFSNGLGISRNLSVGLESAYLFGNINNQSTSIISSLNTRSFGFKQQNSYSAVNLKPGILFRKEIVKSYKDTIYVADSTGENTIQKLVRKTQSSGLFYNIGLTYDYYSMLSIQRYTNAFVLENTNVIQLDTPLDTVKYKTQLPPSFRLGFSIDKPMKWSVSADLFYEGWSVYKPSFMSDTLVNSYGISVGGEITPGTLKLKSKTYRAGFTYLKSPIQINGKQMDDLSVSIGGTVPFGRRNPTTPVIPRVNLAFVYGQRGTIADFGIKDQYFKVFVSILINEKWFNKRKIY